MNSRRRFYKTVEVTSALTIALDGKPVKTPGKSALVLPNLGLAKSVAAEWEAQVETIKPSTMAFTKLANTAIDRVGPERGRILAEMIEYAGSDLVCYRAAEPPGLVERHATLWDPIVNWARTKLEAPFETVIGIRHRQQPAAALERVGQELAACDDFTLTGLHNIMTLTGSTLIALMFRNRSLTGDQAWSAAHADEDFQIAQWGQDEEAAARRQRRHAEFAACCRFVELSGLG